MFYRGLRPLEKVEQSSAFTPLAPERGSKASCSGTTCGGTDWNPADTNPKAHSKCVYSADEPSYNVHMRFEFFTLYILSMIHSETAENKLEVM